MRMKLEELVLRRHSRGQGSEVRVRLVFSEVRVARVQGTGGSRADVIGAAGTVPRAHETGAHKNVLISFEVRKKQMKF